jgi:hypothetical protein
MQQPAQPFATLHRPASSRSRVTRKQQDVVLPQMITLGMVMRNIFAQRLDQGVVKTPSLRRAAGLCRVATMRREHRGYIVVTVFVFYRGAQSRPLRTETTKHRSTFRFHGRAHGAPDQPVCVIGQQQRRNIWEAETFRRSRRSTPRESVCFRCQCWTANRGLDPPTPS